MGCRTCTPIQDCGFTWLVRIILLGDRKQTGQKSGEVEGGCPAERKTGRQGILPSLCVSRCGDYVAIRGQVPSRKKHLNRQLPISPHESPGHPPPAPPPPTAAGHLLHQLRDEMWVHCDSTAETESTRSLHAVSSVPDFAGTRSCLLKPSTLLAPGPSLLTCAVSNSGS